MRSGSPNTDREISLSGTFPPSSGLTGLAVCTGLHNSVGSRPPCGAGASTSINARSGVTMTSRQASSPGQQAHTPGGETHQQAGDKTATLTTNQGIPVSDNQNQLKAGPRRPVLPAALA